MIEKLVLGTVQLGMSYGIGNRTGKPSRAEALAILDAAKAAGIEWLDTAQAYGESQAVIGDYHRIRQERFALMTKFRADQGDLERSLHQALATLGVERIERCLYHRLADCWEYPDFRRTLLRLKAEGLIGGIGASIYTNEEFERALEAELDLIQVPFNLLDNWSIRGELIREAKRRGLEIHVRSVFLQGLFHLERLPVSLLPLGPYLERLAGLSRRSGVPLCALALLYPLQIAEIDKVLFGVETLAQLEENLGWLSLTFDPAWRNEIEAIRVAETALLDPSRWRLA